MTIPETQKIYVLDTSVILYDHEAALHFEEHDVAIPIQVLEELDQFKKGNDTRNFAARQFIRLLDEIGDRDNLLNDWVDMGEDRGRLQVTMSGEGLSLNAETVFGERKNDHKIINAVIKLRDEFPAKRVVLVTKDICLRVKAKALNLLAEDYETGKVKDLDALYTGKREVHDLESTVIDRMFEEHSIECSVARIDDKPVDNQYFILRNCSQSVLGRFHPRQQRIQRVDKRSVCRITPRNAEQAFALDALLDPDIKLVTLRGMAGTGKTLLAIAAAIEQKRDFQQIFITRPVIPLSNKDIGYLPGDVKSKLDPYMQPIYDNIKYIKGLYGDGDAMTKRIDRMIETEKLAVAPLAYIRGRTLAGAYFIVDEAQNLTPHEVKTIISRAGDGTKIVLTGDIRQIDTPYLDAESNGLSYVISKVRDNPLFAHITLEKGERSELANLANELL